MVEINDLSGINHTFKALYVTNSQNVLSWSQKVGQVVHNLYITENTVAVPKKLSWVQSV